MCSLQCLQMLFWKTHMGRRMQRSQSIHIQDIQAAHQEEGLEVKCRFPTNIVFQNTNVSKNRNNNTFTIQMQIQIQTLPWRRPSVRRKEKGCKFSKIQNKTLFMQSHIYMERVRHCLRQGLKPNLARLLNLSSFLGGTGFENMTCLEGYAILRSII